MPADEPIDVVNEHDVVIGTASIGECLGRGLLHRAVAVLVLRSNGNLLLQQRSKKDSWHPGLWTLSSTGHVRADETYHKAAMRELREELGLAARLDRLAKYLLPPISSEGLTEREWVTLYISQTDTRCKIDRKEVERVKEVDELQLRRMFNDGSMTPDAVILLTEYLRQRKWRSLKP